jgi:hypothetical protein
VCGGTERIITPLFSCKPYCFHTLSGHMIVNNLQHRRFLGWTNIFNKEL